jgi:hypothetical protein
VNKLLKISAAVALAIGAASPSYAALVLPNTGNSTAILSILDRTNSTSMVVALNTDLNTLLANGESATGYSNSNFYINSTDASDVATYLSTRGADTIWWVAAVDNQTDVGSTAGKSLLISGTNRNAPSASNPSMTNSAFTAAATNGNDFFTAVNANCPTDNTCTSGSGTLHYAGQTTDWGTRMGVQLASSIGTGSQIGVAQAMWYFVGGSNSALQVATKNLFNNAYDIGDWNLTSEGVLSYALGGPVNEVPLPAAVWLMLSGLAGFGAVSRRRNQAAA